LSTPSAFCWRTGIDEEIPDGINEENAPRMLEYITAYSERI
jgi:hypothetical protein